MLVFVLWSVIHRLTEWCWICDMNQAKLTIVLEVPEVIRINLSHSALAWVNQIIPAAVQPAVGSGRDQNVTQKKDGNATQVPCKLESCLKNIRCECGCRSGTSWIIILVSYTSQALCMWDSSPPASNIQHTSFPFLPSALHHSTQKVLQLIMFRRKSRNTIISVVACCVIACCTPACWMMYQMSLDLTFLAKVHSCARSVLYCMLNFLS